MDLILDRLDCGYGRKKIVENFQATISTKEVFCLLGPNGIGKTTLFKTILGFLPKMGGQILIDGADLSGLTRLQRARLMGYVPQSQFTPFAFRVIDVVLMGRTSRMGFLGRPGRADYLAADEVLERLEIGYLRHRDFTQLSGGERQMVLIARALTQEPVFLMMDEPTSNLDFGNQVKVLQNIRRLADEGLGIILTTHSPDHVFQCGTKAALLNGQGRHLVGEVSGVLTSQNLSDTYGLPISVLQWPDPETRFQVCRPNFS
jgi:iron complex transport system ATP-binding protein